MKKHPIHLSVSPVIWDGVFYLDELGIKSKESGKKYPEFKSIIHYSLFIIP